MFDGALGWAIISSLLDMPEVADIDPFELRQFTINLDITFLNAALGDSFEARGSRESTVLHDACRRSSDWRDHPCHSQRYLACILATQSCHHPALTPLPQSTGDIHEKRHPSHWQRLGLLGRL
ncbi:MAG: hypothetical protein KF686_18020 [Ramlibacter sp.]|nr:hypothetical protein [Ramlibacter sp.]